MTLIYVLMDKSYACLFRWPELKVVRLQTEDLGIAILESVYTVDCRG